MYRVYVDAFSLPEAARLRQVLLSTGEFDVPDIDVGARDASARRHDLLNESDFVVIGAQSQDGEDPLEWIRNRRVRIVRASPCARADESWIYGLPELSSSHRRQIAGAGRVASPGCCAAGAILLLRPLVISGLLAQSAAVNVFCVAGSSAQEAWKGFGAGPENIRGKGEPDTLPQAAVNVAVFEETVAGGDVRGFGHVLDHPYAAEIRRHALLEAMPNFVAIRAGFERGTMLYIPLHSAHMNPAMPRRVPRMLVEQALMKYYEGSDVVSVVPGGDDPLPSAELPDMALRPDAHNGTNGIRLQVFGSDDGERLCLAAVYDNLGKGHVGAILQNLRIMAGVA